MWFTGLVWRGADVSRASRMTPCVVIAPHPDDETLGCGATILAKRAAGTAVRVVIVTDGRRSHSAEIISSDELAAMRAAEAAEACALLGVTEADVVQMGWADSTLDGRVEELSRCLGAAIAEFGPAEVFVPSVLEAHPDHRAVSQAVRRLLLSGPTTWRAVEYPIDLPAAAAARLLVRGGEPLRQGGRRRWVRATARPELVAADPTVLAAKRRAILAYRSQTRPLVEGAAAALSVHDVAKFLRRYEVFWPVQPGGPRRR